MGLETPGFISDLDPDNPDGADKISQGDDHIRLIKRDLLNTFTGITGEVTVTHDELNHLAGLTEDVVELIKIGDEAVVALDDRVKANEEAIEKLQIQADTNSNNIGFIQGDIASIKQRLDALENKGGSGMLTMVEQPQIAGDCRYEPVNQQYIGAIDHRVDVKCELIVPDGMVFALNYITVGGGIEIDSDNIVIDGVVVTKNNYYNGKFLDGQVWPTENGGTPIKVKNSMSVRSQNSTSGNVYFHGIFAEDS